MSIEAIKASGAPRCIAHCDVCTRTETVACDYDKRGNVITGQVHRKLLGVGWAIIKGDLHCPSCEAQRKSMKVMKMSEAKKTAEPAREPTFKQRREIVSAILAAWNEDADCYSGDYTDRKVAEELGGGIMPGWVKQAREQNISANSGNEESGRFDGRVDEFVASCEARFEEKKATAIKAWADLEAEVHKIKAAATALKANKERLDASFDLRVK